MPLLEKSAETQVPWRIFSHHIRVGNGSRCYSGIQIDDSAIMFNMWLLQLLCRMV